MARFFGIVGFEDGEHEVEPGIWVPAQMIERNYFGTVLKRQRKWDGSSEGVNDDVNLTNRISIVADDYMHHHLSAIKYVILYDTYWKVVSFEIQRPRIILNLGGVWNGHKT